VIRGGFREWRSRAGRRVRKFERQVIVGRPENLRGELPLMVLKI
jgi:hypothetical protein